MVEQRGKSTNYGKETSLGRKRVEFRIPFWICPLSEFLIGMGRPPTFMLTKQLTVSFSEHFICTLDIFMFRILEFVRRHITQSYRGVRVDLALCETWTGAKKELCRRCSEIHEGTVVLTINTYLFLGMRPPLCDYWYLWSNTVLHL